MFSEQNSNINPRSCSVEDYSEPKNTSWPVSECENSCPETCDQKILSFDQLLNEPRLSNNVGLTLTLFAKFTPHPVFEEIDPKSRTEFWADLGM